MATIKLYEWFVLTVVLLCEVTDITSADYSARSWGDPHITTVDKVEYEFNGHGEYIFLHNGNTTLQVRADYTNPGNKDSTIFVAVAIKDDIGQFEAQLNRTSGVVTVYKDGLAVCSSNDSPPQGGPSNTMFPCGLSSTSNRPIRGVLVGNGNVLFSLKGFGNYMKTLTLQGGSDISIILDGIKNNISHSNLTGLAGGSVNIKALNGTLFNVSNLLDMFDFGESLRISENESLFNYSLSSGNYSTYNTFSRPTFYEDYLTNITMLFNLNGHQHNDSDINEFDKTCNESKVRDECLLAIARSDDIAAGEAVNINYRHEQYLYNWRHNTPPYFTDEIPDLDVYLADNHSVILNLSYYVHDNNIGDILTFLVETNLPKTHFMLDSVSGIFNWTVLPSLRRLNASIKITFTVHDRFNGTVVRDVKVNFCGCNKTSQCDNQYSVRCNCQDVKYVTGDYCEIRLDPCNVTTCFNQSMCNGDNVRNDTGPCAPCPKGRFNELQSDKQICHDECDSKYDGGDKCDVNSNCTNTDGSYTCTCHHGYRLMSNGYNCEDKDECNEGVTCKENEVCRNTPGNYMCDCVRGYGRKDGGPCVKMEMRVEDAVTVRCNEFGWDVRVNMNTLRQLVPNAKASDIYMGDNSCTGQETWNGYLLFNQGLKECTTYESIRHGESVYSNQLIYAEHDPIRPYIIRHFNWTISLECTVNKNKTTSGHLHNDHLPLDGSIHSVQGADQNDLNMTFYRDPQFSHQIEGNPLHVTVGDEVYVKVFTMTSQKIRVHTCYTKPSIDSLAPLRYMLITNGCEVDPSTHILSQTIRETRFVFTEFEYTTNQEGLFVFCDVTFCNINDSSDQCSQICIR